MLAGAMLKETLFRAVIRRTSQAREPYEQWDFMGFVLRRLMWEPEIEGHLTASGLGMVAQFQQLASEAGNC